MSTHQALQTELSPLARPGNSSPRAILSELHGLPVNGLNDVRPIPIPGRRVANGSVDFWHIQSYMFKGKDIGGHHTYRNLSNRRIQWTMQNSQGLTCITPCSLRALTASSQLRPAKIYNTLYKFATITPSRLFSILERAPELGVSKWLGHSRTRMLLGWTSSPSKLARE